MVGVVLACSCQAALSNPDSVLLEIDTVAEALRPEVALVSWLSDEGFLLDSVRVPELGVLPAEGSPLATMLIELDADAVGVRRVLARGLVEGRVISEAVARIPIVHGEQMRLRLVLQPGRLPDSDDDGVPDGVDNCPDLFNPEQRRCIPEAASVLPPGQTPPDAGPSREAGQPTEAGAVPPSLPDGGAPPDARPPLIPPDAQVPNGILTGTVAEAPAAVNLTAIGGLDWIHFGAGAPDKYERRAKATPYIDPYRAVGAVVPRAYADSRVAYSWTDGMPTLAAMNVSGGVAVDGRRNGFQVNIRASRSNVRRVRIYVGASDVHGVFSAMLSDGSALPYDETIKVPGPELRMMVFTLNFRTAADNKSLIVVWRSQSDGGLVTLESVALE